MSGLLLPVFVWAALLIPERAFSEQLLALKSSPSATADFALVTIRKSDPIPLTLQKIITPSGSSMDERLAAVHSLSDTLSRDEIIALYSFVKTAQAAEEGEIAQLHGLKNDILNVLRNQETPPVGLTALLIEIYQNREQDSVMRDYAIQHLVTWYEQDAPDESQAKEKIRRVLREAARDKSSVAGTALLGMHRLSANDTTFNGEEIDSLALSHVLSVEEDCATRITAIQVCAERGVKAALPAIETLPAKPGSLPLRLSAIAALGQLGGKENSRQIQHLQARQEETLRVAVGMAAKQLKTKEQLEQLY